MNIKKLFGFTLLETLTATAIASIVITTALSSVGSIYFNQKRIQLSHDFYAEGRYMMERIAQIARNNTIDYDRYFHEVGPPTSGSNACSTFQDEQTPGQTGHTPPGLNAVTNNEAGRKSLSYSDVFYWDTSGNDGILDRNMGGMGSTNPASGTFGDTEDNCTLAWDPDNVASLDTLYFINSNRTLRTAIQFLGADGVDDDSDGDLTDCDSAEECVVKIQRQLGSDTDDDGIIDIWGPNDENNDGDLNDAGASFDSDIVWQSGDCKLKHDEDEDNVFDYDSIFGDSSSQDFCDKAHDFTKISPVALQINKLNFIPNPSRDPYLAFRLDGCWDGSTSNCSNVQVHPSVFLSLDIEMRNPERYGFSATDVPDLNFQTSVSSRVFGNIRK